MMGEVDQPRSADRDHSRLAPLVVLTGSSRGIGRATALALGRQQTRLALLGRDSSAQSETLRLLESASIDHRFYQVDLELPDRVTAAAEELLAAQGVPDALINNAATITRQTLVATSVEDWDRQLAVNLRAPFLLIRSLLPAMLNARRGRIVQVASIAATVGTARAAPYCASKWGLVGLTKSLAEELSGTGVSAVSILPGSVDTEMLAGSGFTPRMTAEDVARTITHFALSAPIAHNGASIEMFGV